jgi:hypothetical protein
VQGGLFDPGHSCLKKGRKLASRAPDALITVAKRLLGSPDQQELDDRALWADALAKNGVRPKAIRRVLSVFRSHRASAILRLAHPTIQPYVTHGLHSIQMCTDILIQSRHACLVRVYIYNVCICTYIRM